MDAAQGKGRSMSGAAIFVLCIFVIQTVGLVATIVALRDARDTLKMAAETLRMDAKVWGSIADMARTAQEPRPTKAGAAA